MQKYVSCFSLFGSRSLKSEIPNITGSIRTGVAEAEGAFTYGAYDGKYGATGNVAWWCGAINFAASSSSDRYSDTATEVNPLYQSCLFYVRYQLV